MAVPFQGARHRRQVLLHIHDTGQLTIFLLLASAHDRYNRGGGGGAAANDGARRDRRGRQDWRSMQGRRSRQGASAFVRRRCRISTTSIRWRAICCATRPMPRTPRRNAICAPSAISTPSAAGRSSPGCWRSCATSAAPNTPGATRSPACRARAWTTAERCADRPVGRRRSTPEQEALRRLDAETVQRLIAQLPRAVPRNAGAARDQ